MFIGGPWVRRDRTDAVVGLSHDIEGQRSILAEAKHTAVASASLRDRAGNVGTVGPTLV